MGNYIKDFKSFIKMAIWGGFFVMLPLILFFYFTVWVAEWLIEIFEPVSLIYQSIFGFDIYICHIISLITFIGLCFFIGLIIKTQMGNYIHYLIDELLKKIPGYSIVSDTLNQFFGKDKKSFKKAVLIDRLSNGVYETAFLTDEFQLNGKTFYSLFVPTGPNPTSGFILHLEKDKIIKESFKIDKAMKSIISCGAGSSEIWEDENV